MAEKKYWKGLEEFNPGAEFIELAQKEFPEELPVDFLNENDSNLSTDRRDFLKMMGFSLTAATIAAGCEIPVRRVAPYIFKPEDVTPGIATWYASSFISGGDYCSILVKTREGRPIKIEGNRDSKITKGGTSARAQASVLSLYDTARLAGPAVRTKEGTYTNSTWEVVDQTIAGKLAANPNANIRLLTSTILSPSTKAVFSKFTEKYPNTKVYSYDAISSAGLLMANMASKGVKAVPHYAFEKAKVIVSFDADFLATWISPLEYTKGYVQNRKVHSGRTEMSRHYQVESRLSVTGSNADYRIALTPSEVTIAVLNLYDAITGGNSSGGLKAGDESKQAKIKEAADWLKKHEGESLVISGSNDVNVQLVVNAINDALGNYGNTISFDNASMLRQGNDADLKTFVNEVKAKQVDIVMIHDCNPVYDTAYGNELGEALKAIPVSVSFAGSMDETADCCTFICPDHHYLESWNDAEPCAGYLSLAQPTIQNLFDTRQMQDTLLTWAGAGITYQDFMMQNWNQTVFANELIKSNAFNKALQIGLFQPSAANNIISAVAGTTMAADTTTNSFAGKVMSVVSTVSTNIGEAANKILTAAKKATGLQITLYEKIGIGDGRYANNPWLQEMPDPISKITWDNYINVSPAWAEENNYTHGDVVTVSVNGKSVEIPVAIQPGQANGSASIALGYGRTKIGKVGAGIGTNVFSLIDFSGDTINYNISGAEISKPGNNIKFSQTQTHFSLNDGIAKRKIVKETTLAEYQKNPKAGNKDRAKVLEQLDTFYPDYFATKNGFNWGMSIDLNSCTGCGACTIACNAENNISVVGKKEVLRAHEMHWIRIDRYYAGNDAENPEVVFQPMLCQHCENAPCENVCPVGATNHSHEGFNQMAYNRCIGTRYCANNCPYKVRRFNWFDYGGTDTFGKMNDPDGTEELGMMEDLTRMVLNPDVTVRSRGVIEKCSFCVQRIQDGKLAAKKENRQLRDREVRMACESACPADAIVFGNMFDNNSEVYKLNNDDRTYGVIEENHWLPSVLYLTKVRNKEAEDHHHDQALTIDVDGKEKDIMNLYNYH
ncbi:MAG: TAT-variant-translocated molybdopterin oxidoreductase [Chitinophagales bacterium]|nr:TAT-variant-translocated molybdopterin oxidoreductase [Chitinophagales bacterium]